MKFYLLISLLMVLGSFNKTALASTPSQDEVDTCKAAAGIVLGAVGGASLFGTRASAAILASATGYAGPTVDWDETCEDFIQDMHDHANDIRIDEPSVIDDYIEIVCNGDPLCGNVPHLHPDAGLRNPMCGTFDACPLAVSQCTNRPFSCLGTMVDLHGTLNLNDFRAAISYIEYGYQLGDWAHNFPNNAGMPVAPPPAGLN